MKSEIMFCSPLFLLMFLSVNLFMVNPAYSTNAPVCNNGIIHQSDTALPVVLIHGYKEGAYVWSLWEQRLIEDGVPFCTVTFFSDDDCGTSMDHALEIAQIVDRVKEMAGEEQVNIVAHSKGGLDARVYLSDANISDVKNVIMIGTPNGGGPLADTVVAFYHLSKDDPPNSFFCTPALFDLETSSDTINAGQNPHTDYYTIFGDWSPSLECGKLGLEISGFQLLKNGGHVPNDGVVPAWSSETLDVHTNLGSTPHCHTELLNDQEYNMARDVLLSK
jgi:pimeloyl-ACP methyl ester carboxylesterase